MLFPMYVCTTGAHLGQESHSAVVALMVVVVRRLAVLEQQIRAAAVAAVRTNRVAQEESAALEVQALSFCLFPRQITREPQLGRPLSPQAAPTPSLSSRHQGVTQREPLL